MGRAICADQAGGSFLRTVAIIQARLNSTRFPGKVLADLAGYPVLRHVIERARRAESVEMIKIAVPASDAKVIADALGEEDASYVFADHGDESDLVGRFFRCSGTFGSHLIVRLCADNPCVEPSEIDRAVECYLGEPWIFVSNMHQHRHRAMWNEWDTGYPDGIGCEVFSRSRLQWMHERIRNPEWREHPHMVFHAHGVVDSPACPPEFARPDVRLDVNTPEDLALLNRLYAHVGGDPLQVHITQLIQAWDALGCSRPQASANRCDGDPVTGGT